MKLIIPTHDGNLWLTPLYKHLFDKYELGRVFDLTFLGFTHPRDMGIHTDVSFVCMAEKQICWSRHIYDYLNSILDEHVVLSLEDFLPVSPVNLQSFNRLLSYTLTHNVGRADLTWDMFTNCRTEPACYHDDCTIKKSVKGKNVERDSLYRISTQPSIWQRHYLMRFLKNDWTAWDFEVKGSELSLSFDEEIVCLDTDFDNYPTKWTPKGAVSRILPGKFNCLGMTPDTIKECVDMGFINEKDLIWGMFKGCPNFYDAGGYNFTIDKMPKHAASLSNWEEWRSTYENQSGKIGCKMQNSEYCFQDVVKQFYKDCDKWQGIVTGHCITENEQRTVRDAFVRIRDQYLSQLYKEYYEDN